MKHVYVQILCIGLISLVCTFFINVTFVSAEITRPLYTVDYKPQVIFGDSPTYGDYGGLQNYKTEYVGGYLHMTFTTTHALGSYAGYPSFLYVRSADPTVSEGT